ncbi:37S ribosomal protein S24, mitochondrial [Exophiala xenobiotica]|nr:37S ribosomal protein S24, mitochondrial [Exophiala xenobiotica]
MATTARHVCRTLFQVSRQIPVKRKCQPQLLVRHRQATFFRPLSTTRSRQADNASPNPRNEGSLEDESDEFDPSEYLTPRTMITVEDFGPEERADYDMLSRDKQEGYLALQNHYAAVLESAEAEREYSDAVDQIDRQIEKEVEPLDFPDYQIPFREIGYWAHGEEDEFAQVEEDAPWDDSAISSVAHSELEVHREIREYTRVIAWDMPLLNQYAKPFQPPTDATPLRFRYTTYMGEVHPAAKKVVVQFCTKDLPNLSEAQRIKLVKLVGPRYNPDTDVVKMSCEKFEAPAQNKRYLGDLVNKLLDEARDGKDTFEDVPLDLRHHKSKKLVEFPEEWKIKPSRVQELLSARKNQKLLESADAPTPADGRETVESYVRTLSQSRWGPTAQRQRTL